jgi:hypothetical protein
MFYISMFIYNYCTFFTGGTGGTVLDAGNESPVYIWYIVGATVVCILGILLVVAIVIIVRL